MAQQVKKPPALQKTDVGLILVSGRPLEEHMPTHSSILGWRIPWTEEPGDKEYCLDAGIRQSSVDNFKSH